MANRHLFSTLTTGLSRLSRAQQWGLLLGLSVIIAISFYLLFFIDVSSYHTIVSTQKTNDISNTLHKAGIHFRVDSKTDSVQVPVDQLTKAQSILSGIESSASQFKGFDALSKESKIGTSRFIETARYRHALETELAKTISGLQYVKQARIHLALPKETVFANNKQKASASIFLEATLNEHLAPQQVTAIRQFVADSVSNLNIDDVSIIDQYGTLLSKNDDSKQLFYTQVIEQDYVKRITKLLTPLLGEDKVKVHVSAEVNLLPREDAIKSLGPSVLLKRLSVAVTVDNLTKVNTNMDEVISVPLSTEEIQQITNLIKSVIGFNSARGDQISVVNIPFLKEKKVTNQVLPSLKEARWDKTSISLSVIAFTIFLLIITRTIMKKRADQRRKQISSAAFSRGAITEKAKPIKLNREIESDLLTEDQSAPVAQEEKTPEYQSIASLCQQDAKTIISFLRGNHPQIIAMLLTYLDSEKAARVLDELPSSLRSDILCRIASIGSISPFVLQTLDHTIKQTLKEKCNVTTLPTKGVKLAANIMNYMDLDKEQAVVDELSMIDQKLSQRIQAQMLPFERLAELGAESIHVVTQSVPMATFMLALKGVDQRTRDIFLKGMSAGAAQQLKESLEAKRPVQLSKVMAAQKEVVAIVKRMIQQGEIVLTSSDNMIWNS